MAGSSWTHGRQQLGDARSQQMQDISGTVPGTKGRRQQCGSRGTPVLLCRPLAPLHCRHAPAAAVCLILPPQRRQQRRHIVLLWLAISTVVPEAAAQVAGRQQRCARLAAKSPGPSPQWPQSSAACISMPQHEHGGGEQPERPCSHCKQLAGACPSLVDTSRQQRLAALRLPNSPSQLAPMEALTTETPLRRLLPAGHGCA